MTSELKNTGVSIIGEVPWGTHFCHFYETKQDLLDTLIPYFKTGLESNEFCMWVVSNTDLITIAEAEAALAKVVSDLDRHLLDKNIEILSGAEWYLEQNVFNLQRVTNAWKARLKRALDRGFDGMRVSGDTGWLTEKDWKDFNAYEKQLNDSTTSQAMIVLCTYPLAKSRAAEVLDVVQAHQFATARRNGEWQVIETPELREAQAEIKRLNEELEQRVNERTRELIMEITERRRNEQRLRASEERYRELFENAKDVLYVHDLNGIYVSVNRAAEKLCGYTRDEIIGRHFSDFTAPEHLDHVRHTLARKLITQQGAIYIAEIIARDGRRVPVQVTSNLIYENGKPVGVQGVARDITERVLAEQALRQAEQKYRDIFENAVEGIFQTTPDGKFVAANPALARMFGFDSPEELIATRTDIAQEHYVDPQRREALKLLLTTTGIVRNFELEAYRKDGSRIWLSENVRAVRDEHGSLLYYEGTSEDITERKRAEEALRQSEARYRAIVQDQTELVCRALPNGTLTFVNDAYCRYFGKQREELIGTTFLPLIPEQDVHAVKEHLASLTSLNSIEPLEHRVYNAAGELRWQQWTNRVITDAKGEITEFQSVGRDITERKRAEEALREAERKYRAIFENAEDGIFQTTPEGKTITANRALARMLGFDSPEELLSERTDIGQEEYVDPSQRDEFKRLINEHDVLQGFEYEVYRKDRSRIWISESVRAIRNENGTLLYYEGTTKDITVQKRAEEALLASERRYRDIFTFAPVGIYQSLRDGTLITANNTLAEMLGYASVDELLKVKLGSGMYLSEHERERLTREHEVRGYPADLELQWKTKDGSPIWIQLSAHAIRGANGVTEYWEGFVRDITSRKRAEEALREAEQKYRDIFENAGEGIFQSTPDGQYLVANPALARTYGYETPQELIRSLTDISTQIYVDSKRREEFKSLLAQHGVVRGFEHQVFKKDGSRIWITVNARAVRNEQEQIMYYEGTAQDITERKRADARLREYEKVVEGLDEMIIVVDRDYRYLLANRAYLRYRGLEKEKLIGRFVSEIVDKPEFEKRIKKNLASAFQGQVVKYEMKLTYPEVGERDLFISYFPIEGPEGVDRVACVLQDVTEGKQAEQRLAYHARLLEQVHDAVIAVDERLTLTAWNHAAEQMYGLTADEVLGRDIRDVVRSNKSEAERAEVLRAVDQTGRHRTESVHHRKDGSEINIEGTIMALRNGDDRIVGYAFAYHDITERKLAEEAMRNYSRRLIEAQETERQSISRELHDQIGQILTAVRINLETIAKCDDGANSKLLIDEGVTLVDQALQQVRNLSFELRPSLLDDLGLASALRWYADRYAQRGNICVTTRIELPEHQPRLPREMETVCFRIVQEALTNVARHAQAKRVLIKLDTSNDGISLSIKDDGIGFDKYSRNPAFLPNLLGLRGMEERALALGGKLEINSAPSRGTEIRAHFPNGKRK